jgi:hypothetical protein
MVVYTTQIHRIKQGKTIAEEISTIRDLKNVVVTFTQQPDTSVYKGIGTDGLTYFVEVEPLNSRHYKVVITNG